jgi:hypothetical protein
VRDDPGPDTGYGTVQTAVRWNADPGSCLMKRLFALVAIAGAVAVTACDDPRPAEPEVMGAPMEEPVAPTFEEAQAPVAAPDAAPAPDTSAQPTEPRSSAESVQPDSETLFY